MAKRAVSRQADEQAVADFLNRVPGAPAALVIEGDPGIGKTTLWLDAVDRARESRFTVLASRAARAESVLAYAALADLLADVDESVWADLPAPQRQSLDAALLRRGEDAAASDARAVAAAFVAVLNRLATRSEGFVLVAIDDVQWIDVSSANVVAFAARRLPQGVGLMCTTRSAEVAARIELPHPDAVQRIRLQPLSVAELHRVLMLRLNISVPRPQLARIHQISGGNPLFALELAREMDTVAGTGSLPMPGSLSELVSSRIARIPADAQEVLLAMASVSHPTLSLLAQVTDSSAESVLGVLNEAETQSVVAIDGNRISFTHPILAHGVYSEAQPRRRRAMHRQLAELVSEPELRARHWRSPTLPVNRQRSKHSTPRPRWHTREGRRLRPPNCSIWQSGWAPATHRVEYSARPTSSPPAMPAVLVNFCRPRLTTCRQARFARRRYINSAWSGSATTASRKRLNC